MGRAGCSLNAAYRCSVRGACQSWCERAVHPEHPQLASPLPLPWAAPPSRADAAHAAALALCCVGHAGRLVDVVCRGGVQPNKHHKRDAPGQLDHPLCHCTHRHLHAPTVTCCRCCRCRCRCCCAARGALHSVATLSVSAVPIRPAAICPHLHRCCAAATACPSAQGSPTLAAALCAVERHGAARDVQVLLAAALCGSPRRLRPCVPPPP
jgi:hypothetical protein